MHEQSRHAADQISETGIQSQYSFTCSCVCASLFLELDKKGKVLGDEAEPVVIGGMVLDINSTPSVPGNPRTTTPGKVCCALSGVARNVAKTGSKALLDKCLRIQLAVTLKVDTKLSQPTSAFPKPNGDLFVAFNGADQSEEVALPPLLDNASWVRLVDAALPFLGFFLCGWCSP